MKRRNFVATVSLGLHPSPEPERRCDELHLSGRPVFTLVRNDELSGCPVDQSAGELTILQAHPCLWADDGLFVQASGRQRRAKVEVKDDQSDEGSGGGEQ